MADDEEMVEVMITKDELTVQTALEEVLEPAGIEAVVHDRMSAAFPAPASMPGGLYVAVPVSRATEAVQLLRDAQRDRVLPEDAEIADAAATP